MPTINSVAGPISPEDLGVTMMHEHFFSGEHSSTARAKLVQDLSHLKELGVRTIVEGSAIDMHRNVGLAQELSREVGINAIMASGLYRDRDSMGDPLGFKARAKQGEDVTGDMYAAIVREIGEGIDDTGVRAGIIKVGTGHNQISPYEQQVLKAAARAQMETGVPILTHTEAGTMGPEQAEMLIAEGADPQKLMIGHMDCNADLQYHVRVLSQGTFVSFDRLGFEPEGECLPDSLKKGTLIGLLGMGYANQLIMSQDYVPRWRLPAAYRGRGFVNWTYNRIFKDTLPTLKNAGVTDEQIHTMMVDNPRRLFEGR